MRPKIIYNEKILNKLSLFVKIKGFTFFPWIILRENFRDIPYYIKKAPKLINHETIHIKQQGEMLVILFYIWYGLEWFMRLFKYWSFKTAYKNISFEREAHINDKNLNYLKNRKLYSWIKYL